MCINIRDRRFAAIVGESPRLEKLASGFEFAEGPVWHPFDKYLVFSDIAGNKMYRWSEGGGVEIFRAPSNMANGNTFDRQGRLVTCEHATSRVTRANHNGSIEVLASHYVGKELNSPNDIVVKSDGGVYFTDPLAGRLAFFGIPREQELSFQGVYRFDEAERSLKLLADDFQTPNGLCFSHDERYLFVNDTDRHHIRIFDVRHDGSLANGRVWGETVGTTSIGRPDGMKIDGEGNLYCTAGGGGIYVFGASGRCMGVIAVPEKAANCAWGDEDMRSLFVTASTSLYRVRVRVPGVPVF